jgi:hypothetical protein
MLRARRSRRCVLVSLAARSALTCGKPRRVEAHHGTNDAGGPAFAETSPGVALARALDEAVARAVPATQPDASDEQTDAVVQQVLAERNGAAASASFASTPQIQGRCWIRPPPALLDALEVTEQVQDLTHSVPLAALTSQRVV